MIKISEQRVNLISLSMNVKLNSIREVGDITCSTPEDVVLGLANLKGKSDEQFIDSLRQAVLTNDIDILCGHIDWFRSKLGKDCLDQVNRDQVAIFCEKYFQSHPKDGEIMIAEFLGVALEHFS